MTTVNKAARAVWLRLKRMDWTPLLLCWAAAVFYCFFCMRLRRNPVGSSGYCTYTLQALAWRDGRISLGQDYSWLELAVYNGDWYVSFPPVPSVPLFFLTFLFDSNTPDNLLVKAYVLIGCLAVWRMLRRAGVDNGSAVAYSLLCSFAGCLLSLTIEGAVWYQAQTLAFCFACVSVAAMWRGRTTLSLVCYALSVGCRPFDVVFGLPLLAVYITKCKSESIPVKKMVYKAIPGVVLGLLIAACYAWYNYIRFANPFEFGHNYLPEFSWQGGIQFSLSHVWQNIRSFVLRLPFHQGDNGWELEKFGFCFLIANPVFILVLCWIIADIFRRRMTWQKAVVIACFFVHLFLLLLHRTFGGFQFGARYTCDLLPYAALYLSFSAHKKRISKPEIIVFIAAVAFAVYGAAEIML